MTSPILDYASTLPLPTDAVFTTSTDRPDVTSWADLLALPTLNLAVGSVYRIITGVGSARAAASVELQSGAADGGDSNQQAPADYNGATNNKHWQIVSGIISS